METARPQPGQPRLRAGERRAPAAHLRPATPVDVQRQEPAHLRGGRIKITVAGQHHTRGIPGLGHRCFGAAPVPLDTKHRGKPGPADPPASAAGVKSSQNRRLVSSDHGPRTSNSATRPAIACSARSPIPRTVADGTDANAKIDQAWAPRTSAPITPIGAAACLPILAAQPIRSKPLCCQVVLRDLFKIF